MNCRRCGSENVDIIQIPITKMKRRRTWKYWVFGGWLADFILFLFFGVFWIIARVIKAILKKPMITTNLKTKAICQDCGFSKEI